MTIDSVLGAEIVTADGSLLQVDSSVASRSLLGDSRRRRQLRRGHALSLPPAPGARIVGGMLMLPATARHDRRTSWTPRKPRPRNCRRSSTSCRRRRCRSSPRSRTASSSSMILMCYAGDADGRRARRGAVPRHRRADRRHGAPDTVSGDLPARRSLVSPAGDRAERCSSIAFDRSVADTILDYLQRSDASMRVAQLRVLGGAMARVPTTRRHSRTATRGSWSTSRRSTPVPAIGRCASVDRGLRPRARSGQRRRVRGLPRRRRRGPRASRLPRRHVEPTGGGQSPLRSGESVPAEPQRDPRRLVGSAAGGGRRSGRPSCIGTCGGAYGRLISSPRPRWRRRWPSARRQRRPNRSKVRYAEGLVHGFLTLRTRTGR